MTDQTTSGPDDTSSDPNAPSEGQEDQSAAANQNAAETDADMPGTADLTDDQLIEAEIAGTDRAIEDLELELLQVKDQMLRAVAETENIRKRAQKQTEDAHKYANGNFAKGLLSVADNLRRAIDSVPEDKAESDELVKTLLDGIGAVERELLSAFQQNGIEKLEPIGEPFDPNFHQAMFELESADHQAGTVVQLVAPGYILNGRLLRAAMVGIAKAPAGR